MTAIVGIKDETRVCLYADRGASDNDTIVSMTTPKIWEVSDNIICGYAGSGGLGQMIQYMKWPTFDGDAMEYLRASLAPAIIEAREKMAHQCYLRWILLIIPYSLLIILLLDQAALLPLDHYILQQDHWNQGERRLFWPQ